MTNVSPSGTDLPQPRPEDLALQIAATGLEARSEPEFLRFAVELISRGFKSDSTAVVQTRVDRPWEIVAQVGVKAELPAALLTEALDREQLVTRQGWLVAPLHPHVAHGELLAIRQGKSPDDSRVESIVHALGASLRNIRERNAQLRRIEQLRVILDIAGQWNQAREMEPLLREIAGAATRLLHADRASIFLWDRANHLLVARPALGVEGSVLRIPDSEGIVGQVVHANQPRRVDVNRDQHEISRNVDRQLGYTTQTLLCVPLRSRKGEVLGAFEVINRADGNFTDDDEATLVEIAAHAAIALENTQERKKLLDSRRRLSEQAAQTVELIGISPAIEALRSTIRRVAPTDLAVLVMGENGTGKEVVSQSIHYLSPRRDQPFVAVNCAAITESLLESELFGHERGAFTDAHEAHAGKFELASGGTLFLDEIGDLSPGGQAKLLRVLEEKVVVRVGGSKGIPVDTRVIAATNQDLAELVRQKRFRQDLFFRLNVVSLTIPALRDRREDVIPLADYFLQQFCRHARRNTPQLSTAARQQLENHRWPGNVRELRNVIERLAYLSSGDIIDVDDLTFMIAPAEHAAISVQTVGLSLTDATAQFQSDYVRHAIDQADGNVAAAAKQLGLHRSNLYRKMRQLGMSDPGHE